MTESVQASHLDNQSLDREPVGFDADLVAMAELLLFAQTSMQGHFEGHLFADPARAILLSVFCLEGRDRQASISRCCAAAGVPVATSQRWIVRLEHCRALDLTADPRDGQRNLVRLTPAARDSVVSYLKGVAAALDWSRAR